MFFLSGSKGISWHDRGNAIFYDYLADYLTKDGAWHDLDISALVGKGQKLVLLRTYISETAGGKKCQFRTKGNIDDYNVSRCVTHVANKTNDKECWVYTDVNGVVEYYFDVTTWNIINLVIRGWFE